MVSEHGLGWTVVMAGALMGSMTACRPVVPIEDPSTREVLFKSEAIREFEANPEQPRESHPSILLLTTNYTGVDVRINLMEWYTSDRGPVAAEMWPGSYYISAYIDGRYMNGFTLDIGSNETCYVYITNGFNFEVTDYANFMRRRKTGESRGCVAGTGREQLGGIDVLKVYPISQTQDGIFMKHADKRYYGARIGRKAHGVGSVHTPYGVLHGYFEHGQPVSGYLEDVRGSRYYWPGEIPMWADPETTGRLEWPNPGSRPQVGDRTIARFNGPIENVEGRLRPGRQGLVEFSDGAQFIGDLADGKPSGRGLCVTPKFSDECDAQPDGNISLNEPREVARAKIAADDRRAYEDVRRTEIAAIEASLSVLSKERKSRTEAMKPPEECGRSQTTYDTSRVTQSECDRFEKRTPGIYHDSKGYTSINKTGGCAQFYLDVGALLSACSGDACHPTDEQREARHKAERAEREVGREVTRSCAQWWYDGGGDPKTVSKKLAAIPREYDGKQAQLAAKLTAEKARQQRERAALASKQSEQNKDQEARRIRLARELEAEAEQRRGERRRSCMESLARNSYPCSCAEFRLLPNAKTCEM